MKFYSQADTKLKAGEIPNFDKFRQHGAPFNFVQ